MRDRVRRDCEATCCATRADAATNPYRVWIAEYAGAPYQEVAAKAGAHLDRARRALCHAGPRNRVDCDIQGSHADWRPTSGRWAGAQASWLKQIQARWNHDYRIHHRHPRACPCLSRGSRRWAAIGAGERLVPGMHKAELKREIVNAVRPHRSPLRLLGIFRASRPYCGDLLRRKTGFRQHCCGICPEFGRWMAHHGWGIGELHGKSDHPNHTVFAVVDVDDHVLRFHLRVLERLRDRKHLAARYARRVEPGDPVLLSVC